MDILKGKAMSMCGAKRERSVDVNFYREKRKKGSVLTYLTALGKEGISKKPLCTKKKRVPFRSHRRGT